MAKVNSSHSRTYLVQANEGPTASVIPDTAKEAAGAPSLPSAGRWDEGLRRRIPLDVAAPSSTASTRRHRDQVQRRGIPDDLSARRADRRFQVVGVFRPSVPVLG